MGRWVTTGTVPGYHLTKSEAEFLSGKLLMLLEHDCRLRGLNLATINRLARDMGCAPEQPKAQDPRPPRRSVGRSTSGPVTITNLDGTVSTRPALSTAELRRVAPERLPITPVMRGRVFKRDLQTCRYCGNVDGPFEVDHVIPVALGGATKLWNLVTACCVCNRRKGAQVWRPNPLVNLRSGT